MTCELKYKIDIYIHIQHINMDQNLDFLFSKIISEIYLAKGLVRGICLS